MQSEVAQCKGMQIRANAALCALESKLVSSMCTQAWPAGIKPDSVPSEQIPAIRQTAATQLQVEICTVKGHAMALPFTRQVLMYF